MLLTTHGGEQIILKKWYTVYKDHITLADYEIADVSSQCPPSPPKQHCKSMPTNPRLRLALQGFSFEMH